MARPRTVSDEQILEAARCCFLEHGPQVSTSTIARALNISSAALFKRFGTKENLLIESLAPDEGLAEMLESIAQGPGAGELREQLTVLLGDMLNHMRGLMPRIAVIKAAGLDSHVLRERFKEPPPLMMLKGLTGWFSRACDQELIRDLEPQVAAIALMGAIQIRPFMKHMLGVGEETIGDDAAYIVALVDLMLENLRPAAE